MRHLFTAIIVISFLFAPSNAVLANPSGPGDKEIVIYQDADLTHNKESSKAIQKGIELAFSEINYEIQGFRVYFKYLNHGGNVVRSKWNYETFNKDPNALVIFAGLHSPPLIKNRSFINKSKALTLVPWAAGGTITRYPSSENWIFRLSIDDTKAGKVIINYALKNKKCRMPHLLLEKTPWGDSNLKTMTQALRKAGLNQTQTSRFGWNLNIQSAKTLLRNIVKNNHDCIVLVSNAREGVAIAEAMLLLEKNQRLPVISHWGITGSSFHKDIDKTKRAKLDLSFIQSCFSFTNRNLTPFQRGVFDRLKKYTQNQISSPKDLHAAAGFIHAYDLSRILIRAMAAVKLTGDKETDQNALRLSLEKISGPVQGIIKTYKSPFSEFHPINNPDAHEALNIKDFCMGTYGVNDEIYIIK